MASGESMRTVANWLLAERPTGPLQRLVMYRYRRGREDRRPPSLTHVQTDGTAIPSGW